MTDSDDRITAQQAADLCGVTERTITRWAREGKLRGHPSLRYRRYSRRELENAGLTMTPQEAERMGLMVREKVARFFQVNPKTVNQWTRKGRLTLARVVQRRRYYRTSDVLALAEADQRNPETP